MKSLFVKDLLETAVRYQDKVAFVDENGFRSTTYGELLSLAKKVAEYLRQERIARHSFVCIRMPNCMEFMAAEFGVWLSGCAAVPIGMNSPKERVNLIERDCDCALLVDDEVMQKIRNQETVGECENELPETTDDALLVYTSGSTGVPKGILHTFEPFDKNFPHTFGAAAPSSNHVFGNGVPFYFLAIIFLYDMLRVGATIHLYADSVKADARALQDYILKHGIDVSHISPAVLLRFRNQSPSLKAVITAGEKLTIQCSKDGYLLYNLYGLTETSGTVTAFEVGASPVSSVPLGRCNPGIESRVVGANGEDAPVGEEGELLLCGTFCKEYYKDPELTRQLYRDGWLYTGDIVVQAADGLLYYKNRRDWMVKVNGQRVEPGEVESAIGKMPGIESVVVKGFDDGRGSQYLCAFYIADYEIRREAFYSHLGGLIPEYMHPRDYVRVREIPLNANGKVDRLSLNSPEKQAHAMKHDDAKTEREAILLDIARKVLEISDIGVSDDLASLGLNSVTACEMVRLAHEKGITVKVNELKIYGTIEKLAKSRRSMLYWYAPFVESKRILVFSCGIITTDLLKKRMDSLAEYYNILVVEPFYDHYAYLAETGNSFEDVAGLYYDLMNLMVADKSMIAGFIGFSFGGTVAYEMAWMLFRETGRACKVICGDSPLSFGTYVKLTPEQEAMEIEKIRLHDENSSTDDAKIVFDGYQAVLRLMSNWDASSVPLDVLLFRCKGSGLGDLQSIYRSLVKKLTVVEIQEEHTEFCMDSVSLWHEVTVNKSLEFLSAE